MSLRRSAPVALAWLSVILLASSGGAVINGCSELKSLAAKVHIQNEFVQEASFRHSDPNWCSHAKAIVQDVTTMIQIIKADPNHCRVSGEKILALQKSGDRVALRSAGCP